MVTDGPFAEAKEMVGGYAVYELDSEAEIVNWTERFVDLHRKYWPEWDGEVTILQLQQFNMAG
ncbi:YCII-related domain protein [compost metagenome]